MARKRKLAKRWWLNPDDPTLLWLELSDAVRWRINGPSLQEEGE